MTGLTRVFARMFNQPAEPAIEGRALTSLFGPLELSVLEALWKRSESISVKGLQMDFPEVAYTTLMTTLDRLYKKDALVRSKQGRAFFYEARLTREEVQSKLAAGVFTTLLGGDVGANLVLSTFIQAVGQRDELLLDELERLLHQRRVESSKK
jgi:predicted transcriptional regulator